MATTKEQRKPTIDDDFLAGIKAADNVNGKQPATATTETPTPKAATPATSDKKTLITAKVNETTLKAWKQFCLEHDTNLTAVIKSAMNHYIKDVQSGTIEI